MEGYLKVDPQKLIGTADEFQGTGGQVRRLTEEMLSIVNGLKSAWQGEAANTYNAKFNDLQDDMDKMDRMIQEHVNDLKEMAQQYTEAENANIDTGTSLRDDVIS